MGEGRCNADLAEDATWEWFCAHHGLLMASHRLPLETLESTLADLLGRVRPGLAPTVRFGFPGPAPDTGEAYEWRATSGELLVDGPALTDEVFVAGPLRLLRLATRVIEPHHEYGASYRDLMVQLAAVAFTDQVAQQLRADYAAPHRV